MYKKILVPVLLEKEHSTDAQFEAARKLGGDGTNVTLLHVIETLPGYVAMQIPEDIMQTVRKESEAALEAAIQEMPDADAQTISGHPGRSISDFARKHDYDCIILQSHVPTFQDTLLGSTAAYVVRHASCSVHVIR